MLKKSFIFINDNTKTQTAVDSYQWTDQYGFAYASAGRRKSWTPSDIHTHCIHTASLPCAPADDSSMHNSSQMIYRSCLSCNCMDGHQYESAGEPAPDMHKL